MFKKGMRIRVIDVVSGWGLEIVGHLGTIMHLDPEEDSDLWYVKLDKHPGFPEQDGCWILSEECMEIVNIDKNSSAAILLDKEY